MADDLPAAADPWAALRAATTARIGLTRFGTAVGTRDSLLFELAHARARDAVRASPDFAGLRDALSDQEVLRVKSAAPDRQTYIRRPDLGRQLEPASRDALPQGPYDLVIVIADGLSATAIDHHAAAMVRALLPMLRDLRIGPIVLAEQARVALGDDVGEQMNARSVALLVGERPGLSSPDSLGIYLTYAPRRGCTDKDRNCISNIHAGGLSYAAAASRLGWLLREAMRLGLSGVDLKENEGGRQSLVRSLGMARAIEEQD